MKPRHFLIAALAVLMPLAAAAQEARTAKAVNLRAGPARDYPLVAILGAGTPLAVQGCTEGFGWCDVIGPGDVRGWVYAGNIVYPYQSREVPVLGYGATLGFPIVTFSLGSYWGQYYRNRPWFGHRGRWEHHRPPMAPRPGVRPPHSPRPIVRPPTLPGPPVMRPPVDRPPVVRGPGGRPPEGRPGGEARSPGGDRSRGDGRSPGRGSGGAGEHGRAGGGEQRPQPR